MCLGDFEAAAGIAAEKQCITVPARVLPCLSAADAPLSLLWQAWELRMVLKKHTPSEEGSELFTTLYPAWAHNPVALLSVCLLAQAHEHAAELVLQFGALDMSVVFLVQIDRLVQLFESPILTHVRLLLLEPEHHPYLLKALWGILMLLPQSPAYHTLKNRLSAVPEIGLLRLQLAHARESSGGAKSSKGGKGSDAGSPGATGSIDYRKLLRTYEEVQAKHAQLVHQQKQARAPVMGATTGLREAGA